MTTPSTPGIWHKILIPSDFSECSFAAFKAAANLQLASDTEIVLLHVTEPAHEGLRIQTEDLHDKMKHEAEAKLQELAKELLPLQEKVTVRVVQGRPADAICQTAAKEDVDVILIPTHGHSGLKHMLLGSVSEKVVRHAPCHVLVVRQ